MPATLISVIFAEITLHVPSPIFLAVFSVPRVSFPLAFPFIILLADNLHTMIIVEGVGGGGQPGAAGTK